MPSIRRCECDRRPGAVLAVVGAAVLLAAPPASAEQPKGASVLAPVGGVATTPAPYFRYRQHEATYSGPEDEAPPLAEIDAVRIGWFGPDDPEHPTAGTMWQAASLAVAEANEAGGFEGHPFELVAVWSENPWGTGVRELIRLVYDHDVRVISGAPDGPSAHLVEQVIAKARLPFISPVSTDKSTQLVNVPWIFSCAPGDDAWAPALARAILEATGTGSCVLYSATAHDARLAEKELLSQLGPLGGHPDHRFEFTPESRELDELAARTEALDPAAIVILAGPGDSARLVTALRSRGSEAALFGGPWVGQNAFLRKAGRSAEGVVFPVLWTPPEGGERARAFLQAFKERFDQPPDYSAAYTYDGVNLLIAAVRRAGLNRVRIRDAIRELSPYQGVTGRIQWDPTGQNTPVVRLGTIRNGAVVHHLCPPGR